MFTVSILGDSISTFEGFVPKENLVYYQGEARKATGVERVEQTWWMRLIDRLGCRFLSNGSFSGSMVEGAGFPALDSDERVGQAAGPAGEAPDVVIVFAGINDYGWAGARNQAAGRSDGAPKCLDFSKIPERVAGAADFDALDGFRIAYGSLLDRLREAYPDAEIWCMTLVPGRVRGCAHSTFCYSLRGVDVDVYNAVISTSALMRHMHVADMRGLGFDYEANDGTHPTARGMEQLAALAFAAMRAGEGESRIPALSVSGEDPIDVASLVAEDGMPLFSPEMASRRICRERVCVGCEYARDTGNKWSCVCDKPFA